MRRKADSYFVADTIFKLSKRFHIGNCVTSVPDELSLKQFIQESTLMMDMSKFELREWEQFHNNNLEESIVSVLGLKWCLGRDTLKISDTWV